jgi:hypothetical protein
MYLPPTTQEAIAAGRVDLAFRRWERARVKPGGRQRTAVGVIGFEEVEPVTPDQISGQDAARAGFASREELLGFLQRRASGQVYRIRLRLVGPDPRIALRQTLPDEEGAVAIERRLARLDRASRRGPWTRQVLELIAARPGVRAADLAAQLGRERLPFKVDVRKLKELGLTESLARGYSLSPRGRAVLDRSRTQQ